jgi:hypothetical protein
MITRLVLIDWRNTLRGKPLTADEREQISRGIAEELTGRAIARLLCRDPSVVSREIDRNGGRGGYRAYEAQRRAEELTARPKVHRLLVQKAQREKEWKAADLDVVSEVDGEHIRSVVEQILKERIDEESAAPTAPDQQQATVHTNVFPNTDDVWAMS